MSKTKLKFFTAYHLQTNGQTEVVNYSLGNLLHCIVCDHLTTWDQVLPMAEFTYNNLINRSTGISPFEAVTGTRPRLPVDFVSLPVEAQPSADADSFIRHMQQVHNYVRRHFSETMILIKNMQISVVVSFNLRNEIWLCFVIVLSAFRRAPTKSCTPTTPDHSRFSRKLDLMHMCWIYHQLLD